MANFDEYYIDVIHYNSEDFDTFDWVAFDSFKKEIEHDEDIMEDTDISDVTTTKSIKLYSYIDGFNAGRKYTISESN